MIRRPNCKLFRESRKSMWEPKKKAAALLANLVPISHRWVKLMVLLLCLWQVLPNYNQIIFYLPDNFQMHNTNHTTWPH